MSGSSPNWLRAMLIGFALAAAWGGFELVMLDQRGVAIERARCMAANRAALAEAATRAGQGEAAPALAALARLADCPVVPAWPWALLLGGVAGFALALGLRAATGRIARLEAHGRAGEFAVGAPIPAPARRGAAPAEAAAPGEVAPLAENHPLVRQVTEEMRAQGLNISPEVARHVAALRAPRPGGPAPGG